MEPIDAVVNSLEGDHGSAAASLRIKIAELRRKLRDEAERSDTVQLAALQEVERYSRVCSSLRENVARLEQDLAILRERGLKDRDRIKGLLGEIERKEGDFKDTFVAINDKIRNLERAKLRAENEADEWKEKYWKLEESFRRPNAGDGFGELEARGLNIVVENFNVLEEANVVHKNALEVDEEMPMRSADGDLVSTSEQIRKRNSDGAYNDSEGDEENIVLMGGLLEMKPGFGMSNWPEERSNSHCNDSGESVKPMKKKSLPCNLWSKGKDLTEESLDRAAGSQVPVGRKISQGLLDVVEREYMLLKSTKSSRSKKNLKMLDLSGYPVVVGPRPQSSPKRHLRNQKSRKHTRRILYSEKQLRALERAEEFRRNLKSCQPTFVKSMSRSCVSISFWLVIPRKFSKKHLPDNVLKMVLEDEKGLEYYAIYIGNRGLSAGWRAFALEHNLEVGDALVFELVEPAKFKVYIIRANDMVSYEDLNEKIDEGVNWHPEGSNNYRILELEKYHQSILLKKNMNLGKKTMNTMSLEDT